MDTKPFWQSSTYWGLFVTLFGLVANIIEPWGIPMPAFVVDFVTTQFVETATQISMLVGLVVAARGRNKATTRTTILPQPKP